MFNTPKLSPHCETILAILKAGGFITNKKAIEKGIGSLSSRIAELRKAGHDVVGEWAQDSHGRRYRKYTLAKKR